MNPSDPQSPSALDPQAAAAAAASVVWGWRTSCMASRCGGFTHATYHGAAGLSLCVDRRQPLFDVTAPVIAADKLDLDDTDDEGDAPAKPVPTSTPAVEATA